MSVQFYNMDSVDEIEMKFAVIITRYQGQWVLCKHKERDTWEIPGGRRESGELIDETATRELYEETGAKEYEIKRLFIFEENGMYAMVYQAEIVEFDVLPNSEIDSIQFFETLDVEWTYPDIQPYLITHYMHLNSSKL